MWGKQCGRMYQLTSVFFLLPACAGRNEWATEDNCVQNPFVWGKWQLSRSLAKWRGEDQHQVVQHWLERKAKLPFDSSSPMSDGGSHPPALFCQCSTYWWDGEIQVAVWARPSPESENVSSSSPLRHSCLCARLMAKPYWNLRMSNPCAKMYCQAGCIVPCLVTRGATWLVKLFQTTTSFGN